MQHGREVRGVQLLERREQVGRALAVLRERRSRSRARQSTVIVSPRRRIPLPLPGRRTKTRVTTQSRVRCCSMATSSTVTGVPSSTSVTVRSSSSREHQGLGRALLEATHVDQAGRDDLAGVDGGHAGHRQEDAAPPRHLDDQTQHARRLAPDPQRDDDVAHPAHLVSDRVEDGGVCQACDEDSCRRRSRCLRLAASTRSTADRERESPARRGRRGGRFGASRAGRHVRG